MPSSPVISPRVIGVGGVAFASFNCIVGAGIFGLPALAAAALGATAILAYIICSIVLALVGLCLAEAGSRVTEAGGPFAYATVSFGPVVGGVVGTLMWASCVTSSAAVADLWVDTFATAWPALGAHGSREAMILGAYLVLAAINARGARQGSRLSVTLALAKLVPLFGIVLVGMFAVQRANLRWTHLPSSTELGGATVLVFFAFTGIESGLYASAEVRDARRTIPRAILLAAVVVASLFIGLQLVAQGVLGAELPKSASPLVSIATALFGPLGSRLMLAAVILSTSGFLVADALCSPRSIYALATRGQLPGFLAAVHPRFGTPSAAIWCYLPLCGLLAITGSFRALAVFTSAASLLIYGVCCLGVLRLRAQHIEQAGTPFRAPGGAIVPVAAAALIALLLCHLSRDDLLAALVPVAVSGIAYAVLAWKRQESATNPT